MGGMISSLRNKSAVSGNTAAADRKNVSRARVTTPARPRVEPADGSLVGNRRLSTRQPGNLPRTPVEKDVKGESGHSSTVWKDRDNPATSIGGAMKDARLGTISLERYDWLCSVAATELSASPTQDPGAFMREVPGADSKRPPIAECHKTWNAMFLFRLDVKPDAAPKPKGHRNVVAEHVPVPPQLSSSVRTGETVHVHVPKAPAAPNPKIAGLVASKH